MSVNLFAAESSEGGLKFPSIENLVEWPAYLFEGTFAEFNKIALIAVLSMAIPTVMFLASGRDRIPSGLQNLVGHSHGDAHLHLLGKYIYRM